MEILNTETLKTLGLVALTLLSAMLFEDSYTLRQGLRKRESAYQVFLAKKSKGKELYNYINQDTLAAFPMGNQAVVCGVVPFSEQSSRQTP